MVTLYRPNSLFRDFNRVATEFNKMTRDFDRSLTQNGSNSLGMRWQVEENETVVSAEIPGINPDDISISLEKGNRLTIAGERLVDSSESDEDVTYIRRERSAGSFSRSLQLPYHVDADGVEADYSNGILTITLPRAESDKPRQITVKAS